MRRNKAKQVDTAVIYYSREDARWVAHSLLTDQIGTGKKIIDALADLIRAIDQVRKLGKHDPTIALSRKAPKSIHRLMKRAKPLPREVYDVADRMVRDDWPAYIQPIFKPANRKESFSADLLKAAG